MPVASLQNPQIKYIRKLAQRKFREKEKKFLVEGSLMVAEAFSFRWPLELLVYTGEWSASDAGQKILSMAEEVNLRSLLVEKAIFKKLTATDTPQGVLAVACRREEELAALLKKKPSLLLLVDAVQDPGNLGTIIRSADAAGANGVILTQGTVDLYNPKTLRATMGSLFHLPVLTASGVDGVLAQLAGVGLQLVVGDPEGETLLSHCDFTRPTVLVIGNEARGCSEKILQRADQIIRIPMPGRAESLNVAMAAAIMLYEVVRQRFC
ncbi:MAG: RNA methyltransferase [Bacillota bacterium]